MAAINKKGDNSVISRIEYIDKQLTNPKLSPKEIKILELRQENLMKMLADDQMTFNKGGMSTKKSRGATDYRKGGMVLSSVDNRKKK
jgi:hypothetical protein